MMTSENIVKTKALIEETDVVLIGAGAGLSTAAGLNYGGKRFEDNFPDFIAKYGLTDMYSSVFYPFRSQEEKWAYLSRHIKLNRYDAEIGKVYHDLLKLFKDKEHFVITTNADGLFYRVGFEADKIFTIQGDYTKFQCKVACHNKLYDNKNAVDDMVELQESCRIPTALIPTCPNCGGEMFSNIRIDNYFVQDSEWYKAQDRYSAFLKSIKNKKVMLLELGIGFNTPSIIRYPFEQMASAIPGAHLVRVNMDDVEPSYKIPKDSILVAGDIAEFIGKL